MSCVGEFVDFQKRLLEDFYFSVFRNFFGIRPQQLSSLLKYLNLDRYTLFQTHFRSQPSMYVSPALFSLFKIASRYAQIHHVGRDPT